MKIVPNVGKIKILMTKQGIHQRQLADRAGVHENYISLIMTRSKTPGPKTANRICEALNCSFDDIFSVSNLTNVS